MMGMQEKFPAVAFFLHDAKQSLIVNQCIVKTVKFRIFKQRIVNTLAGIIVQTAGKSRTPCRQNQNSLLRGTFLFQIVISRKPRQFHDRLIVKIIAIQNRLILRLCRRNKHLQILIEPVQPLRQVILNDTML